MPDQVWIEVDYTVQVTEQGRVIMKITAPFDENDPKSLITAANETARSRSAEVLSLKDTMKVDDIKSVHKISRFYFDNGKGEPNLYSPLEMDALKEMLNDEPRLDSGTD